MLSTETTTEVAASVDRAAEILRRRPDVRAFEVRGDSRENFRVVRAQGAPKGSRLNRAGSLGIRVFVDGGSSYAEVGEATGAELGDAIERAVRLARANGARSWQSFPVALDVSSKSRYEPAVREPPSSSTPERVGELLGRAEDVVRAELPDSTSLVSFGSLTTRTVYADSAGSWVETGTLLSTIFGHAAVNAGSRFGEGTGWRAGQRGIGDYELDGGPEALGREIVAIAKESLRTVDLPAGRHRTLCDNTLSGLLAHESFGHLTEFDLVASGWSLLQGHRGETLASENVTIQDSPVAPGDRREGVVVAQDDEGTPGKTVTLLDKGVLSGWMHSRDSAASSGDERCGNARALDARFAPIVRMRNTYFTPGDHSLEEALEILDDGVYLIGGRGGSPRSDGSFMFTSGRGYLVRGGQIQEPIRATAIHGDIFQFLRNVELLTDDFHVATTYFGGCGKWDQSFLHVGMGGPHVLVSEALLGGQGA